MNNSTSPSISIDPKLTPLKCDLYAVVEEDEAGGAYVVKQCLSETSAEILVTRCLNGGGDAYIQNQGDLNTH